jgi:hypothetical protein
MIAGVPRPRRNQPYLAAYHPTAISSATVAMSTSRSHSAERSTIPDFAAGHAVGTVQQAVAVGFEHGQIVPRRDDGVQGEPLAPLGFLNRRQVISASA